MPLHSLLALICFLGLRSWESLLVEMGLMVERTKVLRSMGRRCTRAYRTAIFLGAVLERASDGMNDDK